MDKIKNKKAEYRFDGEKQRISEIEQCKRECEVRDDKKKYSSNAIVVVLLILLTAFMVGVVIYAVYSFVHISGISNLAGIHITPVIKKATNSFVNDGDGSYAMEKVPGYEKWLIYRNEQFMAMYPPEWDLKVNGNVVLKKYGGMQIQRFDSLALTLTFGELANPNDLQLKQVLAENHRKLGAQPTEGKIAGKNALRTGKINLDNGLTSDGIYWALDKKVFYAEITYYGQEKEITEIEPDCQKVIDSLKFL